MVFVFDDKDSGTRTAPTHHIKWWLVFSAVVLLVSAGVVIWYLLAGSVESQVAPAAISPEVPLEVVADPFLPVREVAASYGVPVEPAVRLAEYFELNRFNDRFGGVGLFSIRPSHTSWIESGPLSGAAVDVSDPVQNSQVAMYLLSKFHASGYSWEQSFVIYVFGFKAVHSGGEDVKFFLQFVFQGDLDG